MCHKCENNLHIKYIKSREIGSTTVGFLNINNFQFLMEKAALNTKELLAKVESGQSGVDKEDISLFALITENAAINFAEQYLSKIHLTKDAALAQEIENFRAALTLIQAKAAISGDETIGKIAQDALDKQKYKLGQSAAELRAMLNSQ